MRQHIMRWAGIGIAALVLPACGALGDDPPPPSPIYVTTTPEPVVEPIVATETPAATSVLSATDISLLPTPEASRTPTSTVPAPITFTPSFTPSPTDTPVTPGPANYGVVGGGAAADGGAGLSTCASSPQGGLGSIYQRDPAIPSAIGCPLNGAVASISSAYQPFQNGMMIWTAALGTQRPNAIYVLYNNGTYQRYNDTFTDGVDPEDGGGEPGGGLIEPIRGFGKVWRENGTVRDTLGWATAGEAGGTAQIQLFERGEMLYTAQTGQTYVLVTGAPGTWSAHSGGP
jgi:hypothetical protein